jgi:hypothetical protein
MSTATLKLPVAKSTDYNTLHSIGDGPDEQTAMRRGETPTHDGDELVWFQGLGKDSPSRLKLTNGAARLEGNDPVPNLAHSTPETERPTLPSAVMSISMGTPRSHTGADGQHANTTWPPTIAHSGGADGGTRSQPTVTATSLSLAPAADSTAKSQVAGQHSDIPSALMSPATPGMGGGITIQTITPINVVTPIQVLCAFAFASWQCLQQARGFVRLLSLPFVPSHLQALPSTLTTCYCFAPHPVCVTGNWQHCQRVWWRARARAGGWVGHALWTSEHGAAGHAAGSSLGATAPTGGHYPYLPRLGSQVGHPATAVPGWYKGMAASHQI